jgi:hypothetical protein
MARWAEKLLAVTRVSWHARPDFAVFPPLERLARLSLLPLFVCSLSSCLVDDPPPYAAPKQTPARLDYVGATPLLNQIIVANYLDNLKFSVPFVSEDAGQKVTAMLLLDYTGSPEIPLASVELPPSTLDDDKRAIVITYGVQSTVAPGCHRFTLRVSHTANFDVSNSASVFNTEDLAEAYWWANIAVDAASANTLKDCKDPVKP